MSARLSLSQRLTLLFILLLVLCAAIAGAVQLYSSKQYGNAMVQQLSADLAQQIVLSEPLVDGQGSVDRRMLKPLFDRLMTFNPSVELYVISPEGELLADAAPPGHIKRQRVDITPIERFLNHSTMPVYGDDPRSLDNQKVFSAAPLRSDGVLRGYLYIILQGEALNALAENAGYKTLWSTLLWALLLVAVVGTVVAVLVRHWVTRPVNALTSEASRIDRDSISAIKHLAAQPTLERPGDEVALLRNTFIELARKIASQWDALADSDRQRREFIANISHDLRTPLTSLLGYLETLSMKSATLTPEASRHYLEIALRQGHKVRHLSQQLFELARLEHGAIKPQRERFALSELVSDVVQKFDLPLETQKITLQTEIPSHLPLINADLSMVERVVTNLLDNAIRHTPPEGTIRLRIWQQDEQLQMEVADSGPGVDEAVREQLFLRPSALSQQATREKRGGLGLLIVKRMLELHGGGIELVESTSGACFRFWLPCGR
ncbi:sensor histidine kinase [Pseudocitrobacter cyperus]|uniref:histidine kinase n=1 Tax=Pseudocitrobacter cyperus TaxID=3112843 RepID=A0ABV0HH00_9ENTR